MNGGEEKMMGNGKFVKLNPMSNHFLDKVAGGSSAKCENCRQEIKFSWRMVKCCQSSCVGRGAGVL